MTPSQVIEEIGARLAKAAPPRSRVLLFGSHARGNADADSDFDVLVIEPAVESPISEAVRLRRELRGLGVPIDVVVVDEAKAQRRAAVRGTMVERALREGRLLART
ncbi:MAG: nucleotidyltransferase domain-containing protein [Actinobacteria bacterium]|nr:nucleotidyltransferase domain-containing protein [Actinomycetota bacterium]